MLREKRNIQALPRIMSHILSDAFSSVLFISYYIHGWLVSQKKFFLVTDFSLFCAVCLVVHGYLGRVGTLGMACFEHTTTFRARKTTEQVCTHMFACALNVVTERALPTRLLRNLVDAATLKLKMLAARWIAHWLCVRLQRKASRRLDKQGSSLYFFQQIHNVLIYIPRLAVLLVFSNNQMGKCSHTSLPCFWCLSKSPTSSVSLNHSYSISVACPIVVTSQSWHSKRGSCAVSWWSELDQHCSGNVCAFW